MLYVRSIKVEEDGYTFDSQGEFRRYRELKIEQRLGLIKKLEVHPQFSLDVNGVHIGRYTADFRYLDLRTGRVEVEDYKSPGSMTDVVRLRMKVVEAIYGFKIKITGLTKAKPRRRRRVA